MKILFTQKEMNSFKKKKKLELKGVGGSWFIIRIGSVPIFKVKWRAEMVRNASL